MLVLVQKIHWSAFTEVCFFALSDGNKYVLGWSSAGTEQAVKQLEHIIRLSSVGIYSTMGPYVGSYVSV